VWHEGVDEAADGGPEALDGPLGGLAQEGLDLGEGVLDRAEVGRIGRKEGERSLLRSARAPLAPCGSTVVHDHDVAGAQFGTSTLATLGSKASRLMGPSSTKGATIPRPQPGDEGGLPMAVLDTSPEALPAR
jgi:hypothetical protein